MLKVTFYFSHILRLFFLSKRLLLENSIYIYLLTPTRLLVGLCYLRILTNWSLWPKKRMRQQNFSLNFRMDKLFCQALCRNRSIHYFVSALRNPVVWIVVLNSLSLPNINHEALINKLNIRTLERKFVYLPIRKNNTYQVVFIRAQRYFHSLSLNVLADKHVGFKRGKTPLSFKQFYYRFFIWFKKHVFLTLPFKGWRSEIHLFFEETFTFRKHPSVNFSILIRPRPRCTY